MGCGIILSFIGLYNPRKKTRTSIWKIIHIGVLFS